MAREPLPPPPVPDPARRAERADRIGEQLRDAFDDTLAEGVPPDLAELLRKLG